MKKQPSLDGARHRDKKRSGEAQAALGRKAGPMKHRLTPRGGAKNDQSDLLDEAYDHAHCVHTPEDHESMGWTCDLWPVGGPCCGGTPCTDTSE